MSNQNRLPVAKITCDPEVQARAELDEDTVERYAEAMLAGNQFPPVRVFHDGTTYWLSQGFHRLAAAERAGIAYIAADVRTGTRDDAAWDSVVSNREHDKVGRSRTNADKRRAVEMALRLRPNLSDRAIADQVGVSHPFVAKVRSQVETVTTSGERVGKDGKTYGVGSKPNGPLSLAEKEQLAEIEARIEEGKQAFHRGHEALVEIRDRRLWRSDETRSFDAYIDAKYQDPKQNAYIRCMIDDDFLGAIETMCPELFAN